MTRKPLHGKSALTRLYRGVVQAGRPLVFLDFDDVICLGDPYSGYDVFQPVSERPIDLWKKLWSNESTTVLLSLAREFRPHLILTTSWIRLMERDGFVELFAATGLHELTPLLHPHWQTIQRPGTSRWSAIERWLAAHYEGQPVLILDDWISGTGLADSPMYRIDRVVLCQANVGLTHDHLPAIHKALSQPA